MRSFSKAPSGLLIATAVFSLAQAPQAMAFAKKKPRVTEPADTQANPTRMVTLGEFLDTPFALPDEAKTVIDMKALLPQLVITEMGQSTGKLRARGIAAPGAETVDRYILRGGITSFEASAFSGSVRFGFKPGIGDIGGGFIRGGEGKVSFRVGTLGMDFHIIDTQRQEVVAVGRGSALMGGVGINVDLDFGVIRTPADFVYNSPMTPIFRSAARNAILQMANDPNTNFFMDWTGQVSSVQPSLNKLFLNAGNRDYIGIGNLFTIYDSSDMRIGEVKVRAVEHEQSSASFKNDTNNRLLNSVRVGDRVKIYFKDVPH